MILVMQDFNFAQIQSNLPKSYHFCKISLILPKFRLTFAQISPKSNQICPNLIKFAKKNFAKGCSCLHLIKLLRHRSRRYFKL